MNINVTSGFILFLLPLALTSNEYVVIKNLGDISFYEKTWTHTNNLNLKEYVENFIVLQNATENLIKICKKTPKDSNCEYFRENLKRDALLAQKDIDKIQLHKRVERGAWLEFGKEALKQLLIGCGVVAATHLIESRRMDELLEKQEKDRKMLTQMMEIGHIRNNLTIALSDRVQELEKNNKDKNNLSELINIARQSLEDHRKETKMYIKIFNNNFRQDYFNINDIDTFETEIANIDSLLRPYAQLPTLNPLELIDLCTLSYTNNITHISIHTKIPILTFNNTYALFEFVPIPIKSQNNVKILNDNAKVFFFNNMKKIRVMLPQILNHCKQLFNHTICDSNLHDTLHDMDECMSSIVLNNKLSSHCKFKRMEKRNYFVQLTPKIVFCFIYEPIQFRINCNEQEKIYNLTKNIEIDFSDQCDLHKVLNELHYDKKTFSTIETTQLHFKPKFSIYDEKLKNWTSNVDFFNQYENTLSKLLNKTNELDNTVINKTLH